jgi:hypothetical protein
MLAAEREGRATARRIAAGLLTGALRGRDRPTPP